MKNDAQLSHCERYRYWLTRKISDAPGCAVFVMLNPSTADSEKDDPTIRKCKGFCKRWGVGSFAVVNLFIERTPYPKYLKGLTYLQVDAADGWIERIVAELLDGPLVAAWGNHGAFRGRQDQAMKRFARLPWQCIGKTKTGAPRHPLMLSYSCQLEPYARPQKKGE